MASAVIHLAVAHEVNKKLKRDNDKLLIGSIAPDISKFIGESRAKSHFTDDEKTYIPNIEKFLNKYKSQLNDDFVMGYFVHLYTDYLWFKYFVPEIYDKDMIKKLDGTSIKCTESMAFKYIYNDYTNLNIKLLDEYNMDLNIFYNDPPEIKDIIKEIPMEKISVIINKISIIIENTKENKDLVFDIDNIKQFISMSIELTLSKIDEIYELS